jgi:hypothetical protein
MIAPTIIRRENPALNYGFFRPNPLTGNLFYWELRRDASKRFTTL